MLDRLSNNSNKKRNVFALLILVIIIIPILFFLQFRVVGQVTFSYILQQTTQQQQTVVVRNNNNTKNNIIDTNRFTPKIPKSSPLNVYWRGWGTLFDAGNQSLADHLFPEHQPVRELNFTTDTNTTENDVLLLAKKKVPWHLRGFFRGKIVLFNGESIAHYQEDYATFDTNKNRIFFITAVDLADGDEDSSRYFRYNSTTHKYASTTTNSTNHGKAFFMSMYFSTMEKKYQNRIFYPDKYPRGTRFAKPHFLLYAHGHCVDFREKAFNRLSLLGPPVHYGGKCRGQYSTGSGKNTSNIVKAPMRVESGIFGKNHLLMQPYRFALVMENRYKAGYITEKIINAFFAGCIPIYYGSREVLDIFHRDAFVFYDIDNPIPALKRIAYLERNRTAYEEVLSGPILKDGEESIRKYFSWNDKNWPGNGELKWFVRDMIGYG